jgi:hypothetical protein
MEKLELLKEPFRTAYQRGDSIDYQIDPSSKVTDHSYVKKYGYTSKMNDDCSYSANGLKGFSLSSYGNWGTVYPEDFDEIGKEIFFNMIEENIIKLWRIRAYINGDSFNYVDGGDWTTYDKEKGSGWINCSCPYVKSDSQDKSKTTLEESQIHLENTEVEEVKVGDTVRVYDKGFFSFITGKVTKIVKVCDPENFNPVAVVTIKYQVENAVNCLLEEERALTPKTFDNYYVYNMYTKKEIKNFTMKN